MTDLPEPDSPTMPRVWPLSTPKETSSTAWTIPLRVWKRVVRLETSSIFLSAMLWILGVDLFGVKFILYFI